MQAPWEVGGAGRDIVFAVIMHVTFRVTLTSVSYKKTDDSATAVAPPDPCRGVDISSPLRPELRSGEQNGQHLVRPV